MNQPNHSQPLFSLKSDHQVTTIIYFLVADVMFTLSAIHVDPYKLTLTTKEIQRPGDEEVLN